MRKDLDAAARPHCGGCRCRGFAGCWLLREHHDSPSNATSSGTLVAVGLFFAKAGAFIFGSGLAIVPFLREEVVVQHHWLTSGQFLDAIAMGLITPGPVVITATFIGYLVGGLAGAIVALMAGIRECSTSGTCDAGVHEGAASA